MNSSEMPPLTRERLFTIMAGFKATAVLQACVDLGLFDALADGPATAAHLADLLAVDERGLRVLLGAATGIGLLGNEDDRYDLPPGGRDLLVSTAPGYCGGITRVAASDIEWTALGDLATSVRRGAPSTDMLVPDFPYWVDFATHTTFVTTVLADMVADILGDRSTDVRGILDVGCGHGVMGYTLARRYPDAHLYAQDWPSVLEVTERHGKRYDVGDRTTFLPGDAFTVDLAGPHDVIVVANLLFHFPRERADALLCRLASALAPGGRLVVAGFTAGDRAPQDETHAALLGLLMLTATAGGQMHSTADYRRMLADQGLTDIDVHTRPGLLPRVIVAGRPTG